MRAVRGWLPAMAVGLLLAGAAVVAALWELRVGELERDELAFTERVERVLEEPRVEPPTTIDVGLPDWVPVVVIALAVVAVVAALVLVLRAAARRGARRRLRPLRSVRASTVTEAPDEEELLAAVDAGLADLSDDDGDPRRAVIACWLRLEEAAAGAGTPRHNSDTATDLVVRLLRSHQVSESVLGGLAEVYLVARFTTHPVDAHMRDQARTALRRLRTELAGAEAVRLGG